MQLKFGVECCEVEYELSAEELGERLLRQFSSVIIDKERGDAHVQEKLDRLIGMEAPNVILESHRSFFGKVLHAYISETHWQGAIVTSYLYPICPPLGDAVFFDVEGAADEFAMSLIASELGAALEMIPCAEMPADESESPKS